MIGYADDGYELSDARLVAAPVVSVLILVYNHEQYLRKTLDSVLGQNPSFPFEVLIGEDCSTDGSREIALHYLARYPESVRIITGDRNAGALANARRLLRASRGTYIASLDGDDYWLPGKIAAQTTFLRDQPGCVAVYANAITIERHGRQTGMFNDVGTRLFDIGQLLRRGNFINSSSLMYRASLKADILSMQGELMDYMVHLRIARHGRVGHMGEPLVAYRVNTPGSMLTTANDHVREFYWHAIQSVPRSLVSDADYAHGLADFLRRIFFRAVRTRDVGLYRAWAARIHAASPYGFLPTTCLVAANIARMCLKMAAGQLRPRARRNVLYRR